MSLVNVHGLKPEARETQAMEVVRGQAGLLRQWAEMLEKPGLTIEEHELAMMEVKLSAVWLTLSLNDRRKAAEERALLRPWQELFDRRAGQ